MPRTRDPEHTMELILETGMRLFLEKGYDQTSIQDIMAAAGLSKGAVYHHFKSKEQIFEAVMERHTAYMMALLHDLMETTEAPNGRERVLHILERLTGDSGARKPDPMIQSHAHSDPQFLLAALEGAVKSDAPIIAGLLEEGIRDGSITTEYPRECAEVLLLLINFWAGSLMLRWNGAECLRRLKFIQHTMRLLGVDVVSDKLIGTIMAAYCAAEEDGRHE